MQFAIAPIRVGIRIPDPDQGDGGAHTFCSSVFNEVTKIRKADDQFAFRFIATSKSELNAGINYWHLNGSEIISLIPDRLSCIRTHFERYIEKPVNRLMSSRSYSSRRSRTEAKILGTEIDLLWSLNPDPISVEIPYAITIWDLQHRLQPYFPEVFTGRIWEDREEWYSNRIKRASLIFTGTSRGGKEVQQFYGVDSSLIAVNPMPTPAVFCNQDVVDSAWAGSALPSPYVVYPANFWPHKNHLNLIRAIHILHQSNQKVQLVLTGSDRDGHRAKVLWLAKSLGVDQSIVNMGHVNTSELVNIYKCSQALCFPSFFGPDNLPPLEAMALGIPAIVSDVPGAKEQLGRAAQYFNPNDPRDIAHAIDLVLTNQELRRNLTSEGLKLVNTRTTYSYVQTALTSIKKLHSRLHSNLAFVTSSRG